MAEPIRLAVAGAAGRMGQALLCLALAEKAFHVVAALEDPAHAWCGRRLADGFPGSASEVRIDGDWRRAEAAEVLIDFSSPAALAGHLAYCQQHRAAAVVGTTALGAAEEVALRQAAQQIPLLRAANFSRGIPLLLHWLPKLAAALPGFDSAICETHHRHKKDAPSGTARALAAALRGAGSEPAVAALRGGDVFGEHSVQFLGSGERIEIIHRASGRELFARGALEAARWLRGRHPGQYTIEQVYGIDTAS